MFFFNQLVAYKVSNAKWKIVNLKQNYLSYKNELNHLPLIHLKGKADTMETFCSSSLKENLDKLQKTLKLNINIIFFLGKSSNKKGCLLHKQTEKQSKCFDVEKINWKARCTDVLQPKQVDN